jgi:DNA-binding transcriptional regulator YiaG
MITEKVITKRAIDAIKDNEQIKSKIAMEYNRTVQTVNLWLKNRSKYLTSPASLRIIRKETGLTNEEIIK